MEVKLHPYNALTCSVLICAFNAEATLREAIESARAQTLQDIEIIVVDDGSLDRTALIAVGQMALDRRVILLKQANGGVASARNRAVQAARGVAIAFLDADDRWEKDHLALHVEALATTDVEVTFARARFMDSQGRYTGDKARLSMQPLTPAILLSGNPCTTCSTMVMLRSVIHLVGLFDTSLKRAEDQEWLIRAAVRGCHIVGSGVLSVAYRTSQDGLSSDLPEMLAAFRQVLEVVKTYAPDVVAAEAISAEARIRLYLARRSLRLGAGRAAAAMHLAEALRGLPSLILSEPLRVSATLARIGMPRRTPKSTPSSIRAATT